MAENPRRWHRAVLDFFYVGGADSACGDFYQQLMLPDARDRDRLEAQIIDAAVNDGAHGFGDGGHGGYLATDETQMKHGFLKRSPQ